MVRKDLGMVTAYAYAVSKGYTGTEAEFAELMASYASVAQEAVDAALAAAQSAQAAASARDTAQTTVAGAIAGIQAEGQTQVGVVQAEGATQVGAVQAEGTTQVGAVQAKGTEVLNSIPADYTELSDDVTDLKSALNTTDLYVDDCETAIGRLDISDGHWIIGAVTAAGIDPNNRSRMHYDGMLSFAEGKKFILSADDGYQLSLLIYTVLDDYSSLISSTGWTNDREFIGDDKYYVVVAKRTNNTYMDVETDAPHLHVYYGLNSVAELYETVDDIEKNVTNLAVEIENVENGATKDKLYYNDEFFYGGLVHRVYNPYKNGGSLVLNGQMHCHSRSESTGKYYDDTDSPVATLQAFLSAGYDFMTITDYGNTAGGVTQPEISAVPEGLVWMFNSQEVRINGGADFGSKHMPLYNYNTAIPSVNNVSADGFANEYFDKFAFVSLAHPFYIDTPVSIEEISKIKNHVRFVELYNGLSAYYNDNDPSRPYVLPSGKDIDYAFETMLDNDLVTWGLAVSDSHSLSDSFLKKGCIKLFSNSKDRFSILESLWAGNFYCTEWLDTGIESIGFNNGVFTINTGDSEATTVFKKEGGAVVKTQTGANVSYQMTGEEKYVRAIVTKGNGNRVWTQPIILIKEFDFSNFQFDIK